jgi:adenylate cyclase
MGVDFPEFPTFHLAEMSHPSRPIRFWTLTVLAGATLLTYLLATAPQAISELNQNQPSLSTEDALTMMALENDFTRTLFTKAIVGEGKKQGLAFDENWADEDVHAGPLPALFLRGVARELSKSDVPLRLFLGSDFPIEGTNLFKKRQAEVFATMRTNLQPQHFQDPSTGEFVGMFPDFASAAPCVSCHNQHINSPKTDWVLGDLMGATTWSYPTDSVSSDEFIAMLKAYRSGVAVVWDAYLDELQDLDAEKQPHIGNQWPDQGLFIPNQVALRDSIDALVGRDLLAAFMSNVHSK